MVYPRGNRVDDMSIYLCIANPEDLGNTWKIDCLFSVTLVNKKETSKNIERSMFNFYYLTNPLMS